MISPGSIPAWAGEPAVDRFPEGNSGVYPRVGGGTGGRPGLESGPHGSIPAWAGEPSAPAPVPPRRRVYPRVGGGTLQVFAFKQLA